LKRRPVEGRVAIGHSGHSSTGLGFNEQSLILTVYYSGQWPLAVAGLSYSVPSRTSAALRVLEVREGLYLLTWVRQLPV